MRKVVVPVREEILRAAERRKVGRTGGDVAGFLAELIDLGFEHRLEQLYRRFEKGEISLGYFAQEMGLDIRDLYAALEERGWPTSNILPSQLTEVRAEEQGREGEGEARRQGDS